MQTLFFRKTPDKILQLPPTTSRADSEVSASPCELHSSVQRMPAVSALSFPRMCTNEGSHKNGALKYERTLKRHVGVSYFLSKALTLSVGLGSLSYIALYSHKATFALTLGLVSLYAKASRRASKNTTRPHPCNDPKEKLRIENEMQSLAAGLHAPVEILPRINKGTVAVDRQDSRNFLLIDLEVSRTLNNKELKGVLAHEVSHLKNPFNFGSTLLDDVLHPIVTIGVMALGYNLLSTIPLLSTELKCLASALLMPLAVIPLHLGMQAVSSYGSRACEYLMDFQAVMITKDPESLYTGILKIRSALLEKCKQEGDKLGWLGRLLNKTKMFRSHPEPELRRRALMKHFPFESV